MPQGPLLTAGIAEGYIPKFNIILPVAALFQGQAALIHAVGNIQKGEGIPQKEGVGAQRAHPGNQIAQPLGQARHRGHILGDGANGEGAAQAFEAHEQIRQPRARLEKGAARGAKRPHLPPGDFCQGPFAAEGGIIQKIMAADFLLAVKPRVAGALGIVAKAAVIAEHAVAHPG